MVPDSLHPCHSRNSFWASMGLAAGTGGLIVGLGNSTVLRISGIVIFLIPAIWRGICHLSGFSLILRRSDLGPVIEELGLRKITLSGTRDLDFMLGDIKQASNLRIMYVSGRTFFLNFSPALKEAIGNGCDIKLLVAQPESEFLQTIEDLEGRTPDNDITTEVKGTVAQFTNLVESVRAELGDPDIGARCEYGLYRTAFRNSLVIADGRRCYLIINAPPATTRESIGLLFDLDQASVDAPSHQLVSHFDTVMIELRTRNQTEVLDP